MPKARQASLNPEERKELVLRLSNFGRSFWEQRWKESMALPEGLPLDNREGVVRYLLFRALLNQQGDTNKVREFARRLFAEFGEDLVHDPAKVERQFGRVLQVFREIGGDRGAEIYHVGVLGGIKPLSLFLYRFAAFAIFVGNLKGSLYDAVKGTCPRVSEPYGRFCEMTQFWTVVG